MVIKNQLCRHYQALKIPSKESSRFASLVQKWVNSSGNEWTVKRLKQLNQTLKDNLITGKYNLPEGWATRVNSKGHKILKDGLIHELLCASNDREIMVAQSFFKSYTIIMNDSISDDQIRKFNEAVMGDITYNSEFLENFNNYIIKMIQDEKITKRNVEITPLKYVAPSDTTSPVYDDKYLTEWRPELDLTKIRNKTRRHIETKSNHVLVANSLFNDFWVKYQDTVSRCLIGNGNTKIFPISIPSNSIDSYPIGTISFIQEPGCKLRCVANPALVIQSMAEPLKKKLEYISKNYQQIKTFNQDEGRDTVQSWLNEGKTCFAYDASSFTDRFPLPFQLSVLEGLKRLGLVSSYDIELVSLVAKSQYYSAHHRKCISWTQGQPQGFGPSFHLATLSHYYMLQAICNNKGISTDTFVIVGDDIVISDLKIAKAYENVMKNFGVEINMTKSLISEKISEFAGKLITPTEIVKSIKLKPDQTSADQYVKLLEFYGSHYWNLIPEEHHSRAIKAILPPTLGGMSLKLPKAYRRTYKLKDSKILSHLLRKDLDGVFPNEKASFNIESIQNNADWQSKFDKLYGFEESLQQEIVEVLSHSMDDVSTEKVFSPLSGHVYALEALDPVKQDTGMRQQCIPAKRRNLTVSAIVESMLITTDSHLDGLSKELYYIVDSDEFMSLSKIHQKLALASFPKDVINNFVSPEGYIHEFFRDSVKSLLEDKPFILSNMKDPLTNKRTQNGKFKSRKFISTTYDYEGPGVT